MPPFKYVAYTTDRRVIEGTLDASSSDQARETIQRAGHRLLTLKALKARPALHEAMPTLFGVRSKDVIIFSRLLATLLERGTDLIGALQLLKDQVGNRALRKVVAQIIQELNQGSSFSEAIGKHPLAFPPIYRQIIRVSEQTGSFETGLRQVADYMEREKQALSKVGKAFIYPAFILVTAIGVVSVMMTVVLPKLLEVFTELDAQIPITTRMLMASSNFFTQNKFAIFGSLLGIVIIAALYGRTARGRRHFSLLKLKVPILGRINLLREMSNFSRTMSMMLNAGVTMTQVMSMTVQIARNEVVREALDDIRKEMLKGLGLSKPMAANPIFPRLLVQIAMVGEEAGTLAEDMSVITELYTQEIDDKVNGFIALLQPIMLFVMGFIVAFIAISVIMPMYTVMEAI